MPWLQSLPGELQGILASAPAMYWTRFQTAQMWGQIAMLDIADEVIPSAKLAAAQLAAIAACDGNDGVLDGIIDDPRTCTYNAMQSACSNNGNAPNCLTQAEANAVNTMWDGPRNNSGNRIWFPIDRGTNFSGWDGNVPFGLAPVQFGWDLENPAYYAAGSYPSSYPGYWGNVALNATVQSGAPQPGAPAYVTNYAAVAQQGSNNVADLTDTFGDLDAFMASGGKLVTFVGGNDQLIMPRGVINYYRVMARRYQTPRDTTGFDDVQQFYRLFHVPGTGHCGGAIRQRQQSRTLAAERRRLQCGHQLGREGHCTELSDRRGLSNRRTLAGSLTRPPAPIRRRRFTSAAAASYQLPTGSAAATWRRTFRSR